jgi:acetylornithine/N-succinyldiaminopimelate aminotransferase
MIPSILPTYNRAPLAFERGEGTWLTATDGRRFLDLGAGIAVNALGHAHPALVETLTEQAHRLWHVSNLYQVPEQQRLADLLVAETFADTVFFTNSGTEACELAVKMVRKYWSEKGEDRFEIVTFEGAFHGRSSAAIAAAGSEKMTKGFGPLLPGFVHVPWADPDRARAGRRRHPPGARPVPEGPARPVRRDRRASGVRRGAVRNGPDRQALRP